MKKDTMISIGIWILAFLAVIGLFYLIKPREASDEGICAIKDEVIRLEHEMSIEHRNFCFDKNMEPIYPERGLNDCFMPYCYQRSCILIFCSCDVDMEEEIWCKDENQEIRRFMI